MAQRRPITSHPAFAPLIALWFAALLGLVVAVLPTAVLERGLAAAGVTALVPLTSANRLIAGTLAAATGALLGAGLAVPMARRGRSDPRPTYAELDPVDEQPSFVEPIRRPLRVREEVGTEFQRSEQPAEPATEDQEEPAVVENGAAARPFYRADEFMILSPQPTHPPRQPVELDALLAQFDSALAAFGATGESPRSAPTDSPDPVRAFVARQTGTVSSAPRDFPFAGTTPDHRAELRAALDKLANGRKAD